MSGGWGLIKDPISAEKSYQDVYKFRTGHSMWLDSSAHPKHLPKKKNPCPQDLTGTLRRPEFGCREFGGPVLVQLFPQVVNTVP